MTKNGAITGVVLLVLFLIVVVIYSPILSIWAINLLFGTHIPNWQLDTWFAMLWLSGVIASASGALKSSK